MTEPDWLTWTRELQAIAQMGLAFVCDPYDRERYEMLRALTSRIMVAHTAAITPAIPSCRLDRIEPPVRRSRAASGRG